MEKGASAVRGNNEDRVLLAVKATAAESNDEAVASRIDPDDRATAKSLSADQVSWLKSLPVILRCGAVPLSPLHNLVIVHAGLVPGIPLRKQDPWAAMHMRSLVYPYDDQWRGRIRERFEARNKAAAPEGQDPAPVSDDEVDAEFERQKAEAGGYPDDAAVVAVPVDTHQGEPWNEAWNRHQRKLAPSDRTTVVYGHDAKRGLVVARKGETHTFGLDSGCAYGRKLSALVIEAGDDKVTHRIEQVNCKKDK